MDVGVRNLKQLTVTSPRVIEIIASPRSCRSQCGGHGAKPARLGDTPDSHHASSAASGLLDSRHAYNVAYIVRDRKLISIMKRKIAMTNTPEQNKALVLE